MGERGLTRPARRFERMEIEQVDERDSTWEEHDPRFRAYFFERRGSGYSVDTYDVIGADVSEVIRWAGDRALSDVRFAVALVRDDARGERGLVWLLGHDLNGEPTSLRP